MRIFKNKKMWVCFLIIFLIFLSKEISSKKELLKLIPPKIDIIQKQSDKKVVAGKILDANCFNDLTLVKVLVKNEQYVVRLKIETEITSNFPRIQHTPKSILIWIKENPDCYGTFAVDKGVATNAILTLP